MEKITINIIDIDGEKHVLHAIPDMNLSLMDVIRDAGFPMGNCGGMALCASCHCFVEEGLHVNNKNNAEEDMLDQLHNSDIAKSRLICQIPFKKDLNGVVVRIVRG